MCRPLPHPLYEFDGAEVCLFVKDQKSGALLAWHSSPALGAALLTSTLRLLWAKVFQCRAMVEQNNIQRGVHWVTARLLAGRRHAAVETM